MTKPFTVLVRGDDTIIGQHRQVLATLSGHFRVVSEGTADVELVGEAQVGNSPLLVLARPTAKQLPLPDHRRVVPMLQLLARMRGDASLAALNAARFSVVDMTATIPRADQDSITVTLIECLAAYRLLARDAPKAVRLHRFGGGFNATIEGGSRQPICTIACTENQATASWGIWAAGEAARYVFELDEDGSARPASIRFLERGGSQQAPQTYQHAFRQTWLEVYAMLNEPARLPTYGAADLLADLGLTADLIREKPARVAVLT